MAIIDIQGVRHAYDLTAPTSSKHALVFIHGWLLSRSYWQPVIEKMAPYYQCLAYDLRGFGDSQPAANSQIDSFARPAKLNSELRGSTDEGGLENGNCQGQAPSGPLETNAFADSCYTPAAYARDLAVLLQHLNISSAWLIGHSLGGSIALWGAAQFPQLVKGAICMNAGGGIYLKEEFERFRAAGQQLLKVRPRWLCSLPWIDLLFTRSAVVNPIARSWGRQRIVDFVTAHPEAALGTLLDSTTESEVNRLPQVVSQIKQPAYFLAGAQDSIMEPKYVRHLASFHFMFQEDGDNVIEISNCGHLAMVEQPNVVAATIRSLVERHK